MPEPATLDHAGLAEALLPAVLAAGRVQLACFASGVTVERKADKSPVTVADRQSEELLLDGLAKAAPAIPVIAEELASAGALPAIGRTFFLVDPLDGTREYIAGSKEFSINIGLIADGRPVFGLIYAAALGWLQVTTGAAKVIEADLEPAARFAGLRQLATRTVHTREPQRERLVGVTSRTFKSKQAEAFLERIGAVERKPIGSSLKFCLLARGDADVYPRFGTISEWDTAAGHALLAAAGGAVTTMDGQDLTYGRADAGFVNPPFMAWGRRSLVALLAPS